jgi:hypothetical protein
MWITEDMARGSWKLPQYHSTVIELINSVGGHSLAVGMYSIPLPYTLTIYVPLHSDSVCIVLARISRRSGLLMATVTARNLPSTSKIVQQGATKYTHIEGTTEGNHGVTPLGTCSEVA